MFDFLKRKNAKLSAQDSAELVREIVHQLDGVSNEGLQRVFAGLSYDGLKNVAAGLGTERDKRSYTGFGQVVPLSYQAIETMCRSNWVCKNIVEVRGSDMVREWVAVQWDGKDDETDRQQQLTDAENEWSFREKFWEAVILGRQYGGSIIVVGIVGQDDLEQELDIDTLEEGCIEYMHVFDRWMCSATDPMTLAGDLSSPNFRKPRFFTLGGSEAESGQRVHWTRVIGPFNGRWLPYRPWLQNAMWHDSELQHVIDDVKDYGSVMALLATMFFEANVDVMQIKNLARTLSLPRGAEKINERFNIAAMQKSANRMLMMDAEDKYEKKGNNFSGLGAIVADFRANVAGAAKTPQTLLFGDDPAGLNATGEAGFAQYKASVRMDQQIFLRKHILRGYKFLCAHKFGQLPPNFSFEFNPLFNETLGEKSTRQLQDAQRDAVYMGGSGGPVVVSAHTVAKELKENKVYKTLENAEVKMVNDLEEQASEDEKRQALEMAQAQRLKGAAPGAKPPAKPAAA